MSVSVGTDTYGRVKKVGKTPIVTKFAMLQALPIYPLQSFYFAGTGESKSEGVPFVASSQSVEIQGIPLARVDRVSVAMAYIRGFFGAMAIVGFVAIIPIIMSLTGERLDEFATIAMRVLIGCFVVGSICGMLTYIVPLTSKRERGIRTYCGELLEICADPARVAPAHGAALERYADQFVSPDGGDSRLDCLRQLVSVRARIAQGEAADEMERQTDKLLERLEHLSRLSVERS